jgi:carbon-monoxide dehydrogenase medium subunit
MHRVLLPFEFSEPATVAEAVALADGQRARALAGGVDLVLKMRLRQIALDRVVSLQKIPGLDYVRVDRGLKFGALATLRQIERSPEVRDGWPLLAAAVSSIVSVQTKTMGTAVGNLCVGTPASDVAPALLALEARVRIAGIHGERELPIEEFFVDAGRTALGPHEIVAEIVVPAPTSASAGAFLKLSKTREDIAKINCAVQIEVAEETCTQARIAVGCTAPTPLRMWEAESLLTGRPLRDAEFAAAAEAAAEAVSPISDVRSTAVYRQEMVRVLVKDALVSAASRAAAEREG